MAVRSGHSSSVLCVCRILLYLVTALILLTFTESYHDSVDDNMISHHRRSDHHNIDEAIDDVLRSKLPSYDNPYDEAYWHETLAYTYRFAYDKVVNRLDGTTDEERASNEFQTVESYIEQSVEAYRTALSIYKGILAEYEQLYGSQDYVIEYDIDIVRYHIAAALFEIGETYSTSMKSNHLAYDYYVQSSDAYHTLIERNSAEIRENKFGIGTTLSDRRVIEVNRAICSLRIGSMLLQEESDLHKNQQILTDQSLMLDPYLLGTAAIDFSDMLHLDGANVDDTLSQLIGKDQKELEQILLNEIESLLGGNEPLSTMNDKSFPLLYPKSHKAYSYFQNALEVFQKYHANDDNIHEMILERNEIGAFDNKSRKLLSHLSSRDAKRYMALCLQSVALIETLQNDLIKASQHYEDSLKAYYETLEMKNEYENLEYDQATLDGVLKNDQSTHYDHHLYAQTIKQYFDEETISNDIRLSLAEVLFSLADTYLLQGKYEDSKERYHRTMKWLEENESLAPTIIQKKGKTTLDVDKTLAEYEGLLNQYESMYGENSMDGGAGGGNIILDAGSLFGDFDEESYGTKLLKDDGYEGDLHASLGSLYISKNDYVAASSHLMQAIRLYELNGEQHERCMADAKFNLATLYLHLHDFTSSSREYDEALDLYQHLFGNDVNPMSSSLKIKEALEAFGIDESSMPSFGSLFGEENVDRAFQAGDIGSKVSQSLPDLRKNKLEHEEGISANKGAGTKPPKVGDATSKKTTRDPTSKSLRDIQESNKVYTQQKVNLPDGTVVDLRHFIQQNNSIAEEL